MKHRQRSRHAGGTRWASMFVLLLVLGALGLACPPQLSTSDHTEYHTLTVTLAGSGSGRVASSPEGIDCGYDCTEIYALGTEVTLTPDAPAGGYGFLGWSGDCSGTGACSVTLDVDRSVTATFGPVGLCTGLITDTAAYPMTDLAKPARLEAVVDPQFGTIIRRITDVAAETGGAVIKPMYSTIPAFNADESYLLLYENSVGHRLYDGVTYEFIRNLSIDAQVRVYWHHADPDVLYYISTLEGNVLVRYHVSTDTKEPEYTFACARVSADPQAFMSWDTNMIGLTCSSESEDTAFIFQIDTLTVTGSAPADGSAAPLMAPSGTLAYWDGDVIDPQLNLVRSLGLTQLHKHSSLGRLANGHDTYNLVSSDDYPMGSLVTYDMTDGSARVIIGPATGYPPPPPGTHISAVAHRHAQAGWVAVSIIGDVQGRGVLDNELLLANTNPGGKVCRVAHHRSHAFSGPMHAFAQPHVVISPSGTRLVFASDWGGGNTVDTYVVELPAY